MSGSCNLHFSMHVRTDCIVMFCLHYLLGHKSTKAPSSGCILQAKEVEPHAGCLRAARANQTPALRTVRPTTRMGVVILRMVTVTVAVWSPLCAKVCHQ